MPIIGETLLYLEHVCSASMPLYTNTADGTKILIIDKQTDA